MTHLAPASSGLAWAFSHDNAGSQTGSERAAMHKRFLRHCLYHIFLSRWLKQVTRPSPEPPSPEPPSPSARGGTMAQSGENPVLGPSSSYPPGLSAEGARVPYPKEAHLHKGQVSNWHAPRGWTLPPPGKPGDPSPACSSTPAKRPAPPQEELPASSSPVLL